MNSLTRRRFLLASGAAAVAATAASVGWKDLADRTRTDPLPVGTGVLVLVTLYGGNDGLNTVVPAADPAYQSARPDLAYAQDEVLDIGEGLGLNPGLAGPQAAVGRRHAGDRPRRRLPEARPQPLPLDGHLADRLAGPPRGHRLDRPLAGRATAATRSPPCRWSRCCRRCWRARPPRAPRCRCAGSPCRPGRSATAFTALGQPSAGESPLQAYAARSITDLHRTVDTFGKDVDATPATANGARQPRTQAGRARGAARRGGALRRGGRPGPGVLGEPRRLRHPRRRARHPAAPAHRGRPGRLGVPHAHGGHRPRPRRGGDGLLRVRPPGGRQRQRGHRPRHRGPGVRRGRAGEGRVRRRAAEPHRPRQRRPQAHHRLPRRLRHPARPTS